MISISQYGVTLKRVELTDLELLRYWRNHPSIQQYMEYKTFISAEMQKKWFQAINTPENYYAIISIADTPIGCINSKDNNLQTQEGEGGIFIWEKEYQNSYVPSLASLILLDFQMAIMRGEVSHIRILKDNKRAIAYNKLIGYKLMPGQDNVENQQYVLYRRDFLAKAPALRRSAAIITGIDGPMVIEGRPDPGQSVELNDLLHRLHKENPHSNHLFQLFLQNYE